MLSWLTKACVIFEFKSDMWVEGNGGGIGGPTREMVKPCSLWLVIDCRDFY